MNVTELISALERVEDKSLPVELEGCDCMNPAKSVLVVEETTILSRVFPACVRIEADLS